MSKPIIFLISFFLLTPVFAETIVTKSGQTIEGNILEKTDKYIKIDFYGVPMIYNRDEIQSASGENEVNNVDNTAGVNKDIVPQDILSPEQKGIEYAIGAKFQEAEDQFKKAVAMGMNPGPSEESLNIINDFKKGLIKEDYVSQLFKARKFTMNRQFQDAIGEYEKAIQMNSEYAEPYNSIGVMYFMSKDFEKALPYVEKAVEKDPENVGSLNALAAIYAYLNRFEDARGSFQKAKEILQNRGDDKGVQLMDKYISQLPK